MGNVCNNGPSNWREKECIAQISRPLEKAADWEKDKQAGETKISGVILKSPYYISYCKLCYFWCSGGTKSNIQHHV